MSAQPTDLPGRPLFDRTIPVLTVPSAPPLAEVFRRAAEVVQANGHYKGDYHATPAASVGYMQRSDECAVCAVGAVSVAITGHPVPDLNEDVEKAVEFLASLVDPGVSESNAVLRVGAWNDAPERTADEVVAALLAAAEAVAS